MNCQCIPGQFSVVKNSETFNGNYVRHAFVADYPAGDCREPKETGREETRRNGPPITRDGKTAGGSQEGEQPVPGEPATMFHWM